MTKMIKKQRIMKVKDNHRLSNHYTSSYLVKFTILTMNDFNLFFEGNNPNMNLLFPTILKNYIILSLKNNNTVFRVALPTIPFNFHRE